MREEPYHHTITRHVGPDGRRCRSSDPGAVKQKEETLTYYGELPPLAGGKPDRVSLDTSDLGAAWQHLRELRRLRARELEGLADPILASARVSIAEHLTEWRAAVLAAGTSEKHADLMRSRVGTLADLAGWARLGEVTPESATLALAKLQTERAGNMPARYKGRSAQTRNHYLSHVRQFVRWCVNNDRLDRDRLGRVGRVSIETDRRHDRRAPTNPEVRSLLDHLAGNETKIRVGTTGPQRALAYQTAMATGFRGRDPLPRLAELRPRWWNSQRASLLLETAQEGRADASRLAGGGVASLAESWR